MDTKSNPPVNKSRYPTLIGSIFSVTANIIFLTIVAWILLFLWLCIKQFVLIDYLLNNEIKKILIYDLNCIPLSYRYSYENFINHCQNILNIANKILDHLINKQLALKICMIINDSIAVISIRAYIFVASIPMFILIHFIFGIDGLVNRDIRKFKGAKESSFYFHRIKLLSNIILLTLYFIYLLIPLPVSPFIFIGAMVFSSAIFMSFSIKNYKKYL